MGWAKYFEDNNEIIIERMRDYMRNSERRDSLAGLEVLTKKTIPYRNGTEIVVSITGKYLTERRL